VAAQTGMNFHASIAAAKAAVEGLSLSLAAEWAPTIRVNAIAPSLHNTPLAASLLNSPEKEMAAAKRHPLQRIGNPNHLAQLVLFLLSPGANFITGQILKADGGLSSLR
jgi:NAD(P)-dependent dehydrogenase (short-subunit alcohol dehydrogenase family)